MSEARILSAFRNRKQERFCELLASEVKTRSGFDMSSEYGKALIARGMIEGERADTHTSYIYRLTRAGEVKVLEMLAMGTLPKHAFRLTGTPQEGARA